MNQASIFYIDQTAKGYDFTQYPDRLYVDTCFWNESYGNGLGGFNSCKQFILDCSANGTILYSSSVVYEEMTHITYNSIIRKTADQNGWSQKGLKLQRQKAIDENQYDPRIIDDEVERLLKIIRETTVFLSFESNEDFNSEVRELLRNTDYILNVNDAKHVIIAHMYGINSIATVDGDYWVLDNTNVYVPRQPGFDVKRLGRRNVFLPFDKNIY